MDDDIDAFRALADPIRLRIVALLRDQGGTCCATPGRVCACDVIAATGLSQPTVSHHMQILTRAGLVSGRKQGRWMYYTLQPERFAALAASLSAFAAPLPIAA